ncbi:Membrane protein insertase YidC [uncultured Desulfatiglans sp.]|nr:Membrane protein insertase YidC [uncultured Desulfatiglans sp.]
MEKRTILAFVLSFVVLIGWSLLFAPKEEERPAQSEPAAESALSAPAETQAVDPAVPQPVAPSAGPQPPADPGGQIAQKEVVIETPLYRAVMTNVGPTFKSFKLKRYRETNSPESPWIELLRYMSGAGDFTGVQFGDPVLSVDRNLAFEVGVDSLTLTEGGGTQEVVFERRTPEGLVHRQVYRFSAGSYAVDVESEVRNEGTAPVTGAFKAGLTAVPPKEKKGYYSYVGLVLYQDRSLEEVKLEDPSEQKQFNGHINWLAYEDDYFMRALLPPEPLTEGRVQAEMLANGWLQGVYVPSAVTVGAGQAASAKYGLYLGPRDLGSLEEAGRDLDRVVDFGWTDIIAKPLLHLLRFFNQYIHNYGFSIILLTILVKILFWPLTHKSYKSMKEMQKLQPRLAKIREKYKDNKEMMNREMMGLYKTYKVNPMSGCLPMIIQIPVFIALFRLLGSSIELRHAPFFFWINDLSAPDRLFSFSFAIPFMTPPYGIPVLTLLMGASMFIQQKMTPTPGDPAQAKIMMFLPLIFTFMFINFPSGLVLYWLVNNVLSIGQQYRIQKKPA